MEYKELGDWCKFLERTLALIQDINLIIRNYQLKILIGLIY
jgi:hypothetical protein